jgi:thiol-disulfide isomerase/thioredoxin
MVMKISLILWIGALLATVARAEFGNWTNSEGKSAELELISVTELGGEKVGQFRMRNGRSISIKASGLAAADAKRLEEWGGSASTADADAPVQAGSVFDEVLEDNLVILEGRAFQPHRLETKPKKYYAFYYTASWCGPCQAYTPDLVKFYNRTRRASDSFELVLITSDREEDAMLEYARDKKMPWPQLKFSEKAAFGSKFNHGVTGIPAVIVCDLEGNVVSRSRDLSELRKLLQ